MSSSLAKELAKYNRPAPESLDPELADDFGDLQTRKRSKKNLRDHPRAGASDGEAAASAPAVAKPEGRKLRSDLLADPKYRGRKVDRADFLAAGSSDDEDDEEDDDEEEESASDDAEPAGEIDENLEKLILARRGREKGSPEEDDMDESEDESEDEGDDDEEEEEGDAEDSQAMLLRKPRVSRQNPAHVKNQYSLWCELVGLRIRLQGLVQASFRLPLPDAPLDQVAAATKANRAKVSEAQELMAACATQLGGIVDKLVTIREATAPAQARYLAASGQGPDRGAGAAAPDPANSRKRKRSPPAWTDVEAGNSRAQDFAEKTFDTWHMRTTQAQGGGRKALKAVNRTISQQVDEIMAGGNAFVSRAQLRPQGVLPIGAAPASDASGAGGDSGNEEDDNKTTEVDAPDYEVYNDSSFYQQLLLAFVSSSNAVNASRVADVDDEDVQERLRRKLEREKKKNLNKKREVDTNASKGRKLRFTVHEKLVNFAAPRPVENPSVDTVQLFASLFCA